MLNYGNNAQNVPTAAIPEEGLLNKGAELVGRLREVSRRVVRLGEQLYGSEPRGISGTDVPEPAPTVRRNLESASNTLTLIEDELQRIEQRI